MLLMVRTARMGPTVRMAPTVLTVPTARMAPTGRGSWCSSPREAS
ncbi:MAG TPA: hypothetical protein PLJ27_19290 [Polyangiaceae bacterium]|nr:hypothetical protein [Polyangiaceae bacterium]